MYHVIASKDKPRIQNREQAAALSLCSSEEEKLCLLFMQARQWKNVDLMSNGRMASWSSRELKG